MGKFSTRAVIAIGAALPLLPSGADHRQVDQLGHAALPMLHLSSIDGNETSSDLYSLHRRQHGGWHG